jgi:hypothetical protein
MVERQLQRAAGFFPDRQRASAISLLRSWNGYVVDGGPHDSPQGRRPQLRGRVSLRRTVALRVGRTGPAGAG